MKSLVLSRPHLIVMVGIPGSGKSFFAEKFADTFHAPLVSLQQLMELGDISPKLAQTIIHRQLEQVMRTGQTVVIDTMTYTRSERAELAKIAHSSDYEILFVWVQIDSASAKTRLKKVLARANDKQQLVAEYEKQLAHFTAPNAAERPLVISGKHTYATQVKVVLTRLTAPRSSIKTPTVADRPIHRTTKSPLSRNITIG